LVATSRHGQRLLGSAITSMTRQRHRAMNNVALAALSPALTRRLDTNFPDQPSDLEVHC
jgi:hypothetical protein